jgi:predicted secreted protein
VLTEQDSGKSVTLKVGEQLTLNLRNPASGGYTVAAPVFDERVLRLISRETRPPEPAAPPRLGDFGRLVFVFAAAAPGATDLAVKISREWEKDQPPLDYVKYMVKVVP